MNEITSLESESNASFTFRVITPTSVSRFKRFFSGCASLLDELILNVNAESLNVRQSDGLNTAFIDCTFGSRFFKGIESNYEQSSMQFTLDPSELLSAIQQASTAIVLTFSEPDSSTLRIKAVGKSSISNQIRMIRASQFLRVPKFEIGGSFTLKMKTLYNILSPFKNRASRVKMSLCKGSESEQTFVSIEICNEADIISSETLNNLVRIWNVECKESIIQANYDIGYLLKGISLFSLDDRIAVSFTNNKPLIISSNGLDGRNINFILAPRVLRE